jgi:hypothetical protein
MSSTPPSNPVPVAQAKSEFKEEMKRAVRSFVVKCLFLLIIGPLALSFQGFDWDLKTIVINIIDDVVEIEFERKTPTPITTLLPSESPTYSSLKTATPTLSSTPIVIPTTISTIAPIVTPRSPHTSTPTVIPTAVSTVALTVTPRSPRTPTSPIFSLELLSPQNHDVVVGARPDLQWKPMILQPGCNFRVRLRHQPTNEEKYHTTTTYSWVPHDQVMPAEKYGIWEWQVQIIDINGNVVAQSEIRSFYYKP